MYVEMSSLEMPILDKLLFIILLSIFAVELDNGLESRKLKFRFDGLSIVQQFQGRAIALFLLRKVRRVIGFIIGFTG